MAVTLAVLNATAFVSVVSAYACVRVRVGYSCVTYLLVRPRKHHIVTVLGYLVTADNHPTERCVGKIPEKIPQRIVAAVVLRVHSGFNVVRRVENRVHCVCYHVFLMQFLDYFARLFIKKLNCCSTFYHVSSSS